MRLSDYAALGGHMGSIRRLEDVLGPQANAAGAGRGRMRTHGTDPARWPVQPHRFGWGRR
jgi:hypothetical protein